MLNHSGIIAGAIEGQWRYNITINAGEFIAYSAALQLGISRTVEIASLLVDINGVLVVLLCSKN